MKSFAPAAVGEFANAPALVPLPCMSKNERRFAYKSAFAGVKVANANASVNDSRCMELLIWIILSPGA